MSFVARLQRAKEVLEQQGRLSVRALGRELECSADDLEEIVAELVEVQGVAAREGGVLVQVGAPRETPRSRPEAFRPPTPKHLTEKILRSKAALEGERKQVTVLFADVQGSMELAEQLDPEVWSGIMQRFFAILAAGIERFEGFVDKFTGDGIMALFGAPIAHEDHAQRACFAALHLHDEIARYATELKREQGF